MLNIGCSSTSNTNELTMSDNQSINDKMSLKSFDSSNILSSQYNLEHRQHELLFIVFTLNHDGIYEYFSKCLWLFHRLWIEMKAQSLDFDRVICD